MIRAEIAERGPMRLDRYIALCNAHYYATRDPFGRAGDFVTAPEITQAFGELLGAWCVSVWEGMGRPDPVLLAEAGPGRGTLMADALRLADRVAPGFAAAARVHLIETSPVLRAAQQTRLGGRVAAWHDDIATLPEGPLLLVANEFLDALPVRQILHDGRERAVGCEGERLVWTTLPAPGEPPGERGEAACAWVAALAARIARESGAALIIDYGHEGGATDTLQAVRGHAPADPLAAPGETDLTAHVDFAAVAAASRAAGAAVHGPVPQGTFLRALGLPERTAVLCRAARPGTARQLQAAARRLMDADAMGLVFKALAIAAPGLPAPPGFVP
ncbi:SAM-dependent methyltransferase [Elioraea tepidiphila]|uniref:class I SAM-dependent methyltransferase n=1 Tax=Elioraea tepidiphila TaxID=457934 RepID=UPI000553A670